MVLRPLSLALAALLLGQEPQDVGPNAPGEPSAKEFSLEKARRFLDGASLQWQRERKCLTCHTNMAWLVSGAETGARTPALEEIRKFVEELVRDRWESKGPRWDAEVVVAGAALAFSDAQAGDTLHLLTRKALDRMWTVQRKDGGWNWLKCNWPPMESDDHYGATLALLAVGKAPGKYAETPAAKEGVRKVREYLAKAPSPLLHQRAMVFWASKLLPDLMAEAEQKKTIDELLALQRADGGWATATLGDWKRSDDKAQETQAGDGYGTGFVVYLARLAGIPASDERLKKGVEWLRTHQRESGRWYTRSLNKDGKHFLTHAGTSFAVLALHACGDR